MSRWVGIWGRCARRGTGPSTRWRRGGPTTPKRPTRRGWPISLARWITGRAARTATVRAAGWVSRFKSARRDRGRVRFTTGTMRLEPDRRTIVLPVIGPLRSKENTRRVQRHLAAGRAQILNMTLSQRWGRLFVSINYALRTRPPRARWLSRPWSPGWTWGCGRWPRSPPSTRPLASKH